MQLDRDKSAFGLITIMVFLSSGLAAVPTPEANLRGRVLDSHDPGLALVDAHVLFRPDQSTADKDNIFRETDAMGRFEIQLQTGLYDMCVMQSGFTPQCKKIFVAEGSTQLEDVHMKVDPLFVEHFADIRNPAK